MTMQVINYQSFNKLNDYCVPAVIGDALFISGGLLHEIPHDVTYLSMTFVDKDFVLSYDDRCVISDVFLCYRGVPLCSTDVAPLCGAEPASVAHSQCWCHTMPGGERADGWMGACTSPHTCPRLLSSLPRAGS